MSDPGACRPRPTARRWVQRLWLVQLGIVAVGVALLATTEAGVVVVVGTILALLASHVAARRSLGRDLAELGRPDVDEAPPPAG